MRLQSRPRKPPAKSPSLDENNQLQLDLEEQAELDRARAQLDPECAREFVRKYWQERLRAARRTFNDPDQVERIVQMLEATGEKKGM